jgi:hypothetical protein
VDGVRHWFDDVVELEQAARLQPVACQDAHATHTGEQHG